jgi:hypothetical protein
MAHSHAITIFYTLHVLVDFIYVATLRRDRSGAVGTDVQIISEIYLLQAAHIVCDSHNECHR